MERGGVDRREVERGEVARGGVGKVGANLEEVDRKRRGGKKRCG